ncbi:hypothetical protein GGR53DRAFT_527256 [Hypoxylon sp. FL1150]|nr:hypothetical protein GGR53DRAFT_527256 [Hypoxylon sp. FL1150]
MGRPRLRGSSPVYLTPSPTELSPSSSVFEDWEQDTTCTMDTSRPTSLAITRTGSPFSSQPSLTDILSNTAPPPWTLSSFMAFLSQNHCLETLEFIMDAERYRATYYQIVQGQLPNGPAHICSLWRKVIDAYIMPCAPREVNLPAHVRDRLLELPCCKASPPDPSELDEAVQIVRDLINDSVLVPFLQSVMPAVIELRAEEAHDYRDGRTRLAIPGDLTPVDDASHSPRASYLPLFIMGRSGGGNRSNAASIETADIDLTDDSGSPSSTPGAELMTPPTTPPTSDFPRSTSPSTLQKAISGHSWKRMGAKLGLTRKTKSVRRAGSTSASQFPSNAACYGAFNIAKASWEDPHPGERFSVPLGVSAGLHIYPQTTSGDAMGGVAAKARCAHYDNGWTTRRSSRGRYRNTVPKPLKIPDQVLEEPEAKSAPLVSSQKCHFNPLSPLQPLEFETDTETETDASTETGTLVGDADTEQASLNVTESHFSDFSNYLGKSHKVDDDDSLVTVVDSDAFRRASSVEDLYGWDAELDRQIKCGFGKTNSMYCRFPCGKADDGKRSLLQRVFSTPVRRANTGF